MAETSKLAERFKLFCIIACFAGIPLSLVMDFLHGWILTPKIAPFSAPLFVYWLRPTLIAFWLGVTVWFWQDARETSPEDYVDAGPLKLLYGVVSMVVVFTVIPVVCWENIISDINSTFDYGPPRPMVLEVQNRIVEATKQEDMWLTVVHPRNPSKPTQILVPEAVYATAIQDRKIAVDVMPGLLGLKWAHQFHRVPPSLRMKYR